MNIEIEEEIPQDLFERLSKYVETPMLRKTRYRIPHLSYVAELDIYHGVLEGLATAEIEFPNLAGNLRTFRSGSGARLRGIEDTAIPSLRSL